jgi:hypothetical protein
MAETVRLKAAGLSRYSDALSKRPEGSLNVADNIVIDQDNIYSPRRGFQRLAGDLTEQAKNIIPYSGKLLLYAKDADPETKKVIYLFDPTDTGNEVSKIDGFSSTQAYIRSAESNGNIYFTGSDGIYKLDGLSEDIKESGIPEALPPKVELDSSGTILDGGESFRYRVVFGYKDANNNLVLGAPSNAVLVSNPNPAGTKRNVKVTIYFPEEITTSNFYQIYRTAAAASSDTGDLCQLIYEGFYSSGTSTTVTDQQPDELRGKELYTNDTVEGIQNANYQPPKASDITLFNNHLFYSDITFRQRFDLQLLAGSGFTNTTSTITIAGQTYIAAAAEDLANKKFLVNPASGSPAVDIGLVAESICRCVNANSSSTVYAYYDSGPNDLPGMIRLEERDFGGVSFEVSSSANCGDRFSPNLNTAPVGSRTSVAEDKPNLLMFSKYQEPEAVPVKNQFEIGSRAYPIIRIMALRDSLFVFKGDGIWRVTGTSEANFSVDAFDSSTKVISGGSMVVLNNLVFGLFDQGICQVSESGVSILSREIEGDIRGYIGSHYANLANLSFGVAYETDRKYILWLPVLSIDTYPTKAYVFNTITQAWTIYDRTAIAGVVNPADDRLYMAGGENLFISKERKDATYTDFSDEQIEVTVSTVTGADLIIGDVVGIKVGDMYVESDSKFSIITAINGGTITLEYDLDWQTGDGEVRKQYDSTIEWNPIHLNSPGHMKQWYESLILCTQDFRSADLAFKTELDSGWESIAITGNAIGDWGMFNWGELPWGGGGDTTIAHRTYIPRTKQRSATIHARLIIDTLYTDWEVSGIELTYRDSGQRLLRR